MKNFILAFIFISVFSTNLSAQQFANEWINFDQSYYRIQIIENGIYRISASDLSSSGISVGSFNPQNIQIFHKGQEIPIYVKGENLGIIEYIEFYAKKNDGSFDTPMYASPEEHINKHFSLINDTASYYITWNESFSNLRYSTYENTNTQGHSPLSYCYVENTTIFSSRFLLGNTDCEYIDGEGWVDNYSISLGNSLTKSLNLDNAYTSDINANIEFSLIGFSSYNHHLKVYVNESSYIDTIYLGKTTIQTNFNINPSELSDNTQIVFSSINDVNSQTDYSAISYIKARYPHTFNFGIKDQFEFFTDTSSIPTYISIENFNHGNLSPVIYDITNNIKIGSKIENANVDFIVPALIENNKLIVVSENAVKSIQELTKVDFIDFSNSEKNYIIITHPKLWNKAQEYQLYRDALLVSIEQLYNQFSYGIYKHPLAIKNFCNYILTSWENSPEYLLLLGKSVKSQEFRNNPEYYEMCLIPSIGNPASDNLLTAGLKNTIYEPAIATGRICVQNNTDISNYLNKVKDFESQIPAEWMKRIIHFGGGKDAREQAMFENYLSQFETIIEDTLFGGQVSTFLKNSSDPIQITQTDSVNKLINNGCSMMTFFGHASTVVGFDQNIDDPENFDNLGKYPFLLANSCYTGDIHLPGNISTSENWILTAGKGTIGFLAVVFEGYSSYLFNYSLEFYKNISYKQHGISIGKIIQNTTIDFQNQGITIQKIKNTSLEFTLHGDPAVVLNSFSKPDLICNTSSINFSPKQISTALDSFNVRVIITNIGKSVTDTFIVKIDRIFPDGTTTSKSIFQNKSNFKDTITVKFPVDIINGPGNNIVKIYLDANNQINELSEINNETQSNLFIRSSSVIPVFPYNLGIAGNSDLILKASTGDPFANNLTSIFEIDTTDSFSSPIKIQEIINHNGGVINWNPDINYTTNQEYFWQISNVPEIGEDYNWEQSSFTYIPNMHGWNQSDYDQLKNNTFTFIESNSVSENFNYISTPKLLRCHNIGSPSSGDDLFVEYTIDSEREYAICNGVTSIVVAVIDSLNLIPWKSDRADYGHYDYPKCHSRNRPDKYFIFQNTESGLNSFVNFLDIIPEGSYILIYSFNRIEFTSWPESVFESFEELGSQFIRSIPNFHPFIFFSQKGSENLPDEIIGTTAYDEIDLEIELKGNFYYGTIETDLIGPAKSWESFEWEINPFNYSETDSVELSIIGVKADNSETILINSIQSDTLLNNLSSNINAAVYPYVKLKLFTYDKIDKTPVIPKFWRLSYECVGEAAINPNHEFSFYSDSLEQGEEIKLITAFENVSSFDMDSLQISYWITDNGNNIKTTINKTKDSLRAQQIIIDTVTISSLQLENDNQIWIEANSINSATNKYYQLESTHFNNIGNLSTFIRTDNSNPILDVTFDGNHIIDGQLVSAMPEIIIELIDDNNFIPISDTSFFRIYLSNNTDNQEKRIYFTQNNGTQMEFIPAELPDNKCQIIYNPIFTTDGKYKLRVQATDASNNESGSYDYQINFDIITKSTITKVLNYPNPFSTATHFVFTITGSQIPDDFRIQIFTITGKFVKEIDLLQNENIHVGHNITKYAWDGKDMYGDKLANGVYFYKFYTKINDQSIEESYNESDKYFKKEYGKMVIIR